MRFTKLHPKVLGAIAVVMAPWLIAAGASYIIQSGNVTYGHLATWAGSGVLQDAGTSDIGNINTEGITANGGTPFCISTAKSPAARVKFCLGVQAGNAATMSIFSYNGAAVVPFNININGTIYPFPATPTTLGTLRVVSSGTTDSATSLDGTIAWNSSSASGKTETLYACGSGGKGSIVTVTDEIGTAGTYPITVAPSGVNTINNASTYIMAFNYQSVTFQCAGAGNWIVQ